MLKLNAQQLREYQPNEKDLLEIRKTRKEIYLLLDNIYDTYNIGGLFRLSDAVGVKTMYLCGRTECPPNPRIHKSSVGTHKIVDWEYCSSAQEQIKKMKKQNPKLTTIAVEQAENSVQISQVSTQLPVLLVVGDETNGVSPSVLQICDQVVEIPMLGVNKSLNVIVSAAMVLSKLCYPV